jgi:hypothetical protein
MSYIDNPSSRPSKANAPIHGIPPLEQGRRQIFEATLHIVQSDPRSSPWSQVNLSGFFTIKLEQIAILLQATALKGIIPQAYYLLNVKNKQ